MTNTNKTTSDEYIQLVGGNLSLLNIRQLDELRTMIDDEVNRQIVEINANGELTQDEINHVKAGNRVSAIISIRERIGFGLADAKKYLDKATGHTGRK